MDSTVHIYLSMASVSLRSVCLSQRDPLSYVTSANSPSVRGVRSPWVRRSRRRPSVRNIHCPSYRPWRVQTVRTSVAQGSPFHHQHGCLIPSSLLVPSPSFSLNLMFSQFSLSFNITSYLFPSHFLTRPPNSPHQPSGLLPSPIILMHSLPPSFLSLISLKDMLLWEFS